MNRDEGAPAYDTGFYNAHARRTTKGAKTRLDSEYLM